jgi:predicted DNA-binding transcriptional regulator AlpA
MRYLTVKEYAEKTGQPLSTVYAQIRDRKLPESVTHIKAGKSTHIIAVKEDQEQAA